MKKTTRKDTPATLLSAITAMQDKLLENKEAFLNADLTLEVEMGDGRTVCRANPFVQEYRALVKDFSRAVVAYKEISGNENKEVNDNLSDMRNRLKVIV